VATLRTVFPAIESFSAKGPLKSKYPGAENLIFFTGAPVAMVRQPEFPALVERLVAERRLPFELPALLATRREQDWPPGVVLTDDYAPFDLLMGRGEADSSGPSGRTVP
jgi:hypothetical protein